MAAAGGAMLALARSSLRCGVAACVAAVVLVAASGAQAASIAQLAADTDRAVSGSLGEAGEQALFGALADASVQVADAYEAWVKTGSEDQRRAALATGSALLPLLEKLRAHHQGRLDKAQADIIAQDGNPETLYNQKWWQLDRGFTLAAAGQLAWLHYRMAMLSPDAKDKRRQWLEKARDEFSEFTTASDEKMRLESILGRGLVLAELGEREAAESDLVVVMQEAKGTPLYWPARMAVGQMRAAAGGAAAASEAQKLLAEAQSAGIPGAQLNQIRLVRYRALVEQVAAGGGEGATSEAAQLAAQLSSAGFAQQVTAIAVNRLKDPRPVLGGNISGEWIAAENLAAAEKFEEAAKAYERIARSGNAAGHADEVHHRLGVCYFRLGRYADAEREMRTYLSAAPKGPLAPEAAYLQFRAAEGVFRKTPSPETQSSFRAVTEQFVKSFPQHESAYEARFRYAELLQNERRYAEAADQYAKVEGPPAFRLRAAAAELQCLADVLTTTENVDAARAAELRTRADDAWKRFDKLAGGAAASDDLKARTTVAHAMVVGTGPGSNPGAALAMLADFEKRFPKVTDLALPVRALRAATATATNDLEAAEPPARELAAMPGTEANYFDLIEKLSRALLRRSADVAPTDPAASQRWAAIATMLFDRLRSAGRPIPDEVKINLAQSYVEQNRLNDAAAIYTQLLSAMPESRSLLRASALLADKRSAFDESAQYWGKLAQLQEVATPAWYEARLATAAALASAAQKDKACANLREVEGFRPDLRDAQMKKRFADLAAQHCAAAS